MHRKSRLTLVMMAVLLMVGMVGIQPAKPVQAANPIRISQAYGGGGDSGATYTNDFIELFNSSDTAVNLTGWSVQFTTSTGLVWQVTPLNGIIPANGYYLIQEGAGGGGTTPLPTPDDKGSIYMVASSFKVALVDSTTALTESCPTGVVDFIGVGTANCYEGTAAAPAPSITTAIVRKDGGCTDDDKNSTDFEVLAPTPRNTASPINSCGSVEIFPERFFISEYIEGSSNNKAIELYNGTGADINLQNYKIVLFTNGSTTPGNTLTWTTETILNNGDTYVIVNSSASAPLLALADITSTITNYNGDDALVLFEITPEGDVVQDSFGQHGFDPGTAWGSGDTATVEHTLVRKETVCQGDIFADNIFEPSLEYYGFAVDTFTNLGSHTMTCSGEDFPPIVGTTVPAHGGTAQKTDNIVITFSEPVTVVESWFSISCTTSSTHTAVVTDADPAFTLNPDADFTVGETCTVTIDHTKVNDDDSDDATADYMLADYVFSFTIAAGCGDVYTPIYDIQGTGDASPVVGQTVSTEGVVVGDFQVGGKNGYYIQEPNADADPLTSNGIFVYNTAVAVTAGDRVRVNGAISEWVTGTGGTLTELTPTSPASSNVLICSTGNTIAPTEVTLPVTAVSDFERYEGMLVKFPQSLIISEYFNFDRYGEIVLTSTRHMTPTAFVEPGPDAVAAAQAYLLDRITLDDGRTAQNPDPAIHPNGEIFDMDNLFRGGGTVTDVTGILDFYQGLYRVQPTMGASYEDTNPRTAAPDIIEADLKVASFNVLNYFVTLDGGTSAWICGPSGNMECRGADTAEEFGRQRAKILAALDAIDADVFGLMEIENEHPDGGNAVADLVAGLNDLNGAGTYAYIETGPIGGDAIKQAILYKPAAVTPVGDHQILDSSVDPHFIDTLNRPVLAQVFRDNETGHEFVVAVNHLKSKGSACTGDPDTGDGQGNCNLTRKAAAQALVDWLANPAYFPDVEKTLIIGDLNSYDKEDPIDMIKLGADDTAGTADDYMDMIFEKRGELAYGYVYDGQTGYLDHALANQAMAESIVDVNFWHINADEPDLIDYDMSFKAPAQDALYAPDAYRSSDHDPVIITLDMNAAPVAQDLTTTTPEETAVNVTLVATDAENDELTYAIVAQPAHGAVTLADNVATYTPALNYYGPDTFTYKANDGLADSNVATVTITVTPVNDAPVAQDQSVTTPEDTALEITLVATDVDGNTLTYAIVDEPAHGEVELIDNIATYTPAFNYFGEDSFTFKANDGTVDSNVATITIMTTAVNDVPIAEDQAVTTIEETPIDITLTAVDIEGDPLEYAIVAQPAHGTVTLVGNIASYTPALNYFGEDSFTFTANDGFVDSDPATVTITVTNVKDQVEAVDDSYATNEDTTLTIAAPGVLENDIDVDNNIRAASLVTDVQHGTLSLKGDGSFIYEPDANFFGTDTFVYKLVTYPAPQSLWTDEATVTITVTPVDDAPVLGLIEDATIPELVAFSFTATATDVDVPAQVLTFSLVDAPEGAAIDAETGVFTWTPSELQGPGVYTFTVKVCDSATPALCDEQEVTLTVTEVNVAPVAQDLTATTPEETSVDVTLVASDAEGNELTYTIIDQPARGTVTLVGTTATYTPALNFVGEDSFTYKANDGLVDSNVATVTITITAVNDAPVAVDDEYTVAEKETLTITAPGVLRNDSDVDGDTLSAILVDTVSNGMLELSANGSFIYTPNEYFNGTDSFTYKAKDATLESELAVVTITVTPVNDWVEANDDEYETMAGVTLEVAAPGVLENDVLLDPNETVTLDVNAQPTNGTLTLNDDGSFTYVPDAGFIGVDTFKYQLTSILPSMLQGEFTDTAIVTIKVTARQIFLPLIMR